MLLPCLQKDLCLGTRVPAPPWHAQPLTHSPFKCLLPPMVLASVGSLTAQGLFPVYPVTPCSPTLLRVSPTVPSHHHCPDAVPCYPSHKEQLTLIPVPLWVLPLSPFLMGMLIRKLWSLIKKPT